MGTGPANLEEAWFQGGFGAFVLATHLGELLGAGADGRRGGYRIGGGLGANEKAHARKYFVGENVE
jgi:hypothetical protein